MGRADLNMWGCEKVHDLVIRQRNCFALLVQPPATLETLLETMLSEENLLAEKIGSSTTRF